MTTRLPPNTDHHSSYGYCRHQRIAKRYRVNRKPMLEWSFWDLFSVRLLWWTGLFVIAQVVRLLLGGD